MANSRWQGTSGDVNAAGSWSEGSVPNGSDTLLFNNIATSLTTNMSQLSAITSLDCVFAQEFSGSVGDLSNPFEVGGTGTLVFNSPKCPQAFFQFDATAATMNIQGTSSDKYACYLKGTGTSTDVATSGNSKVRAGSGMTITNAHVSASSMLTYESGAVGTTVVIVDQGRVVSFIAHTTIFIARGSTFIHESANTTNLTTIHNYGTCIIKSRDNVITKINNYGTLIDEADIQTITDMNLYPGSITDFRSGGSITLTNNVLVIGSPVILGLSASLTQLPPGGI